MITNPKVATVPSIKEAGLQIERLARRVVDQAKEAGITGSYAAWVGKMMSDSHRVSMLHPSNCTAISQAWPYTNRCRYSYCDDQIRLAVQVAIILAIGDVIDADTSDAEITYANFSLRHSVVEAQTATREIIAQLVTSNTDEIDTGAALYLLLWPREWSFLTVNTYDY